MEFKKLLGQRVYVIIPKKEELNIIVNENTKEALNKELLKSLSRVEVYAVGDAIENAKLKKGDSVLVDPSKLSTAQTISLSSTRDVALITIFDIVHIW